MRELERIRVVGPGLTEEDVLATRTTPEEGLPLPPIALLAPYSLATAERAGPEGPIEVRLWMNERDASAYLARREREGVVAAALFRVLPSRLKP